MPEYKRPQNIQDLALRLSDLGYWPVPIPAGCKGPTVTGWQNLRLNFETIPDYFAEHGMLVGILHTNVLALDIDVYDEDLSREIVTEAFKRFPGALERIGQAPKSALFFRMDEPGFKVKSTDRCEVVDEETGEAITAQVEVRSVSRQIVAYGKHPETGRPYTWPRGELWETPWADLPLADRGTIEAFRDWCNEKIRKWAGVAPENVTSLDLHRLTAPAGDRPSKEAFHAALAHVSSNCPYEEWLNGLMGIHDFYNGSGEGLEAAKQWSANFPDYSAREVESKWRSFEVGKGTTYKAIFGMAKANGADMSAIARIDRPAQANPLEGLAQIIQQNKAASAQHSDPIAQRDVPPSSLEWFEDVSAQLTDSYLIKGVLSAETLSAVYGPSNSGKTFFVMDMAFHIAAGIEWRGRKVKKAAVLYLASEGGRGVINRMVAIKRNMGIESLPFAVRRAGLDLLQSEADLENVYRLANEVKEKSGIDRLVIVVDTLSRAMAGGDENSAQDMTALIRNIDAIREATNAHVILVHHTGKDAGRGARGHSSLRAAVDTEIELQVDDDWRGAVVTKQRDYNGGETFAFELKSIPLGIDQDGDEVSSCVVVEAEEEKKRKPRKLSKNQRVLVEVFDMLKGEGVGAPNPGGPMMPERGRFWAIPADQFREACEGKFAVKNTRAAFLEALDPLIGPGGIMEMAQGLIWRIDR